MSTLPLQSVQDEVAGYMTRIQGRFQSGAKITVMVRIPEYPDRDICISDDDLDEAIELLKRRKGEPSKPKMPLDRAQEIVVAINERALHHMGLPINREIDLASVTLPEMLEAVAVVQAENKRVEAAAKGTGTSYSRRVVPAERLVAAAYALQHFDADPGETEPLVSWPGKRFLGEQYVKVLAIAEVLQSDEAGDDD